MNTLSPAFFSFVLCTFSSIPFIISIRIMGAIPTNLGRVSVLRTGELEDLTHYLSYLIRLPRMRWPKSNAALTHSPPIRHAHSTLRTDAPCAHTSSINGPPETEQHSIPSSHPATRNHHRDFYSVSSRPVVSSPIAQRCSFAAFADMLILESPHSMHAGSLEASGHGTSFVSAPHGKH